MPLAPLILAPILKEKVWGGRRLARYNKQLPPDANIGESWELADLASTSASGGGGDAARSLIARGPHAGRSLHDLISHWGDDLIPRKLLTPSGDFPLLVKFLDAREHLSIQVHPSPDYAATHPDAHLKTECWFILDAERAPAPNHGLPNPAAPGPASTTPVLYKGLRPGITPAILRQFIAQDRVPEAMLAVPAIPGQMHNLPSGTIHALGAGVLVAEVQTPSDTTFRLYDWAKEYGRAGRALHIEQSMACIDFGPAPAATALPAGETAATLVRNPHFTVDQVRLARGQTLRIQHQGCQVLMVIGGAGSAQSIAPAAFEPIPIQLGDTVVLPAGVATHTAILATQPLNLLRVDFAPG